MYVDIERETERDRERERERVIADDEEKIKRPYTKQLSASEQLCCVAYAEDAKVTLVEYIVVFVRTLSEEIAFFQKQKPNHQSQLKTWENNHMQLEGEYYV